MLENEYKIIREAQKGKSEHFGLLYDHYSPQIYRFIYIKVSHKQEAEDLTHEVFLSAWKNIENYNYKGLPFSSWLYQIARNRVIDFYRTRKQALSIDQVSENAFSENQDLDQIIDKEASISKVKESIKKLAEDYQNIIILRFIEDLSTSEISKVINKSEGAIRIMQYRAIRKLKEILEA